MANIQSVYVLIAGFFFQFCFGSMYTWAVFNQPIASQMANDKSADSLVPWTFSINIFFMGLTSLFAGPLIIVKGPRLLAQLGAGFFFFGQIITAVGCYIGSLWVVFLGFGVICGIASGLGNPAAILVLQKHFPNRRGLAAGVAFGGFGLGALLAIPYALLIKFFNGETHFVFLITAFVMVFIQMPLSFFLKFPLYELKTKSLINLRNCNSDIPQKKFENENYLSLSNSFKSLNFLLAGSLLPLGSVAGLVLIPRINESVTKFNDSNLLIWVPAVSGIFNVIGRLGFAFSLDIISLRILLLISQLLQIIGLALCAFGIDYISIPMYICGIFIVCLAYGGILSMAPGIVIEIFGTVHLARLYTTCICIWAAWAFFCGLVASLLTLYEVVKHFTLCLILGPFCILGLCVIIFGFYIFGDSKKIECVE